jgi:exodeoxyribonuclease-3
VKVATWNVNSLRARHDLVVDWTRRERPDVLLLQETKVKDSEFPTESFQRLGYEVAFAGQKTYNGVAIVAASPLSGVRVGLADATEEDEKRLIAANVAGTWVYSCYVPNGRSLESEQFQEKLLWLERLKRTLELRHDPSEAVLLGGDFNIATDERDVFDPAAFEGKTHFHPEEHARLGSLRDWGLSDALRLRDEAAGRYTWWDYRAGAFRRNLGLRIDYLFVTKPLVDRCEGVHIDKAERKKPKPSDHAPVIATFRDE